MRKTAPAQAAAADAVFKRSKGESIKYGQEFLLKFMEMYTKCPIDLQNAAPPEILIVEDSERQAQREVLQRAAAEVTDDRDWRTRAGPEDDKPPVTSRPVREFTPKQAPVQQQQQQQGQQPKRDDTLRLPQEQRPQPAAQVRQEATKIQKAEDIGRQAYKPGAAVSSSERALRQVKGILNKLTPEKFERLLAQLLEVVATAELLKTTISMVFEAAVAQPTFCAMYADLCLRLSHELPSFPPGEGDDKPIQFKRVLLNTCQDEFEGVASARQSLTDVPPEEREAAEKRVKSRTLGTIRLIAELYRKDVIKENIIDVCIRELLGGAGKALPVEDDIEAACEMITIAGKTLASCGNDRVITKLDGYMARLARLADAKELSARIRFVIRDVIDMRKNKWVPRRETFTAKKLDQVHAEAEAELGMVSSKIALDLPALPAQSRALAEDIALLPPLRGGLDGWEFVGKKGQSSFSSGGSALLGDYKPPAPVSRPAPAPTRAAAPAPQAAPVAAAAAPVAPAKAAPGKELTPEELENKATSTYQEYLSVGDYKEAAACIREIQATPKADMSKVVETGLKLLLDTTKERERTALITLLQKLGEDKVLTSQQLTAALGSYTNQLEDLALDVPYAPDLLGKLTGALVNAGLASLEQLEELLKDVESAEPRRGLVASTLKAVKAKNAPAIKAAPASVAKLLAADEMDGDIPSVADFLKEAGLSELPH